MLRSNQSIKPTQINNFKTNPYIKISNGLNGEVLSGLSNRISNGLSTRQNDRNISQVIVPEESTRQIVRNIPQSRNINPYLLKMGINPYLSQNVPQNVPEINIGFNRDISQNNLSNTFTQFIENFDVTVDTRIPIITESISNPEREKLLKELEEKNLNKCREISTEIIDGKHNETECMICMDKLRCPVIVLCCCKIFCQECIQSWIENRGSCVHCRFIDPILIFPDDIKNTLNYIENNINDNIGDIITDVDYI